VARASRSRHATTRCLKREETYLEPGGRNAWLGCHKLWEEMLMPVAWPIPPMTAQGRDASATAGKMPKLRRINLGIHFSVKHFGAGSYTDGPKGELKARVGS